MHVLSVLHFTIETGFLACLCCCKGKADEPTPTAMDDDIDYDVTTTSALEPVAKRKNPKLVATSKQLKTKANDTHRPAAGVLSGDKSTNSIAVSNARAKRAAKSKDSPSPTSTVCISYLYVSPVLKVKVVDLYSVST